MIASINKALLDERLAALESARAWSPRLISKLESHIRSAPDRALFRVNPFTFAREKSLSEAEAIDLFLHAAALGIFEMNWLLLCPLCSCVVESFQDLKNVHNHYHCYVCQSGFEAKLDEFIAIMFTINPSIRDLKFHHPERLSAREHFFEYSAATEGRVPDGTPFVKVQESVAKAVTYLPPGARLNLKSRRTKAPSLASVTRAGQRFSMLSKGRRRRRRSTWTSYSGRRCTTTRRRPLHRAAWLLPCGT